MNLLEFLKLVIGPEFTYCHVVDPRKRQELSQGFVDDLINQPSFTSSLEVLSFYFIHSTLILNVKRIIER